MFAKESFQYKNTVRRALPWLLIIAPFCCGRGATSAFIQSRPVKATSSLKVVACATKNRTVEDTAFEKNRLATELLHFANEVGQVGKKSTEDNRQKMAVIAGELAPYSDPEPARIPLEGVHELVYSASEAGPPAGLLGPFVGKVSQIFWNETVYENVVKLGPIRVSIFAHRQVTGPDTISVSFYETQVRCFGKRVISKEVDLGEPGTWKQVFVGEVEVDKERLLLRVMNTPKLFVLKQKLD